ncbi:MAG: ATP-binding cassette domain-containing protein [Pseudomonadota bacterium]
MTHDLFLSLRHIRKQFGAFTALKDINLDIRKGEFVCFLGPSGCGKTTLLRIIAGLDVQTSGEVHQNGRDISRLPPALRDYGIVFQSYALFPNLSVADNVAYGLVNRKTPKAEALKRVSELLRLVGLPGSEKKYPSQLSGGQQQRIALARALATSPGLLLLDEPLSALDALERVRLRQEIRALQQTLGVTTIMVTHDQEEALSVADRIVVMNHGAIEQVGTPKVNVLPAQVSAGRLQLGVMQFAHEGKNGEVKVYLRPEDVLARPISEGDAYVFDACIEKIEFLGSFCHVHVAAPCFGSQQLTVYLSLNFLAEQSLVVGSSLKLRLLPERLKVF